MPRQIAIREFLESIPVRWQRMQLCLEMIARAVREGAALDELLELAMEGKAIFTPPLEHHLPVGALDGGGPITQESYQNAARVHTFIAGINRRAQTGAPAMNGQDAMADELADWIESRLRPVYRDKWKDLPVPPRAASHPPTASAQPPPPVPTKVQSAHRAQQEPPTSATFTAADLAEHFGLEHEPLRKRLERWRKRNVAGGGWAEDTEATSRRSRYLYQWGSVRDVVLKAVASAEASGDRPAKRK